MKCPMRKIITTAYSEPASYDCGYPNNTKTWEEFDECLGEECAWYDQSRKTCSPTLIDWRMP